MNKKLARRIIAWIGVVFAVAFAPLLVLNFYKFGGTADALIDTFLWTALAGAVICFGLTKFIIVDRGEEIDFSDAPSSDAGQTDDGEGDVDDGNNDVPDGEGNEDREDKDDGGSD